MSSYPGLPTTVAEALALVANASPSVEYVENGGNPAEYAAILEKIATERPLDRADFSKRSYVGVLNADGSSAVTCVETNYGGTPVFEYSGDMHAEDSYWSYREIDSNVLSGPDPLSGVTQAAWSQVSGRTYPPFFPRRAKPGEIARVVPGPRKEAKSKTPAAPGATTKKAVKVR